MVTDGGIAVLDFGGQYAHLIVRRIRELGVSAELMPYNTPVSDLKNKDGVILSGGPRSTLSKDALTIDKNVWDLGRPILGICYGHQLIAKELGGKVTASKLKEYGRTKIVVLRNSRILKGSGDRLTVWMSHGDTVKAAPPGFKEIAKSQDNALAAMEDTDRQIFGLQFHPEVTHTQKGRQILSNFVFDICNCKASWSPDDFIQKQIAEIKKVAGNDRLLCAVSGGIDSTTAAVLTARALGDRLQCLFVNHGLLRAGEAESVLSMLKKLGLNVAYVDASDRFLASVRGVEDPEEKRRIIGKEFAEVFKEFSKRNGPFQWLVQGTLYPDIIESGSPNIHAARIKSHHNVAALPTDIPLKVLEPLKDLYKDQVRIIALKLGIPQEFVKRHPFPGPGLAVRIMGRITRDKLEICRKASYIFEQELKRSNLYYKIWQGFAIVGDDKAVGVSGDQRSYGHIVILKAVKSEDGMTAEWAKLPYSLLERVSRRITNEVKGVSMVAYGISDKPPATIEPQ
ncbi:MAG: glutamine-hydrolyzing GMP synthase [Conexivisphaerales archaeon]